MFCCLCASHLKLPILTFLGNAKRGALGVQLLPSATSAKSENHSCLWKLLFRMKRVCPSTLPFSFYRIKGRDVQGRKEEGEGRRE